MKLRKIIFGFSVSALAFSTAFGSTMTVTGDSEFVAVGRPSAIKIHGQGSGVKGDLDVAGTKVSGNVDFPLDQFATGVDLRDKHMKEKYLETPKFPNAHLVIKDVMMSKDPAADGFKEEKIPFSGTLTLHGVTHDVNGTIDLNTSGGITKGEAQFELKITDFKIDVPKYLGITVADTVQVTVHLTAAKKKA